MKLLNWFACFISCFTLSIAPLAQGVEAEHQSLKQAQDMVQWMGMAGPHKVKTLGELWHRIQHTLPAQVRNELSPWVKIYFNEKLPDVSLQAMDGKNPGDIVKMIMTRGTETVSAELGHDPNKFMKVNGVNLTAQDTWFVRGANEKLNKLPFFKNPAQKKYNEILQLPVIPTFEQYSAMNAADRAYFHLHLRLLLESADKVNRENGVKSAGVEHFDKYIVLLKALLGEDSGAAQDSATDPASAKKTTKKPVRPGSKTAFVSSSGSTAPAPVAGPKNVTALKKQTYSGNCVVAGYISKYVYDKGDNYCSHDPAVIFDNEQQRKDFAEANASSCSAGQISCNPTVYGYQSDGKAACITAGRKNVSFQVATYTCDSKLPVTTPDDQMRLVTSLMHKQSMNPDDLMTGGKAKTKEAYDKIMKEIVGPMQKYIKDAIKVCSTPGGESKQSSACETLIRRKAALGLLEANLCEGQVTYTPDAADKEVQVPSCEMKVQPIVVDCPKPITAPDGTKVCPTIPVVEPEKPVVVEPIPTPMPVRTNAPALASTGQAGDESSGKCSDSKFYCSWTFWGVLAAIGGVAWWMSKQSGSSGNPTYKNPVPPPCPATTSCTTIDPTTIAPPPPISPEGGTGTNTNITTGGTITSPSTTTPSTSPTGR